MPAQDVITQRNYNKEPQQVVEGVTVALYGITPNDPAYAVVGQDAALIDAVAIGVAEKREGGKIDRQEVTPTSEENIVNLSFKTLLADKVILQWAGNLPAGALTPDESRSFLQSYDSEAGIEQFQQWLGCKPTGLSISVDTDGYIITTIPMSYKTYVEDTSGPTLGTGSFGTPNAGTPLTHIDGGLGNFAHNSIITEWANISIDVSYVEARQKSGGTLVPLYRKPTQRAISGTVDIYKKDGTLQAAARLQTPVAASIVLDVGQITFTFGRFIFKPSGEDLRGDTSDSTLESKTYEADTLIIS